MSGPGIEGGARDESGEVVATIAPPPEERKSKIDDAAFYGPVGELVRLIEPHSEADPVALLVTSLVALGNLIGSSPHMMVEGDRHPARLNAVLVGVTSKGRKGTSWGRIRSVLEEVDPTWVHERVKSGLVSGEGIVFHVRDDVEPPIDRRMFVIESEFASLLRVQTRDGNTLSPTIRCLWDSGNAETLAKNAHAKTTGAQVAILGHVTQDELLRYLSATEQGNGFANRFLWIVVQRSKVLPFGGGELPRDETARVVARLRAGVSAARRIMRVGWSNAAGEIWKGAYPSLSEGLPGMVGAMTSRAEAQAIRLALTYALMDGSSTIEPAHLLAALAVLVVAQRSVTETFVCRTGDPDADRIGRVLQETGTLDRTGLSNALSRNVPAWRIDHAIDQLERMNLVRLDHAQSAGRPTTTLTWMGPR